MVREQRLWVPSSTRDDLVRAAAANGFRVKERLVIDWTQRGLIDQPGPSPGLGQARGRGKGTWPHEQRQLFLLILRKREELARARADFRLLYNIPVAMWLWFDDRYVPMRQGKRALGSWLRGAPSVSAENARKAARDLVRRIAHPESSRDARSALADIVAEAMREGTFERARLERALSLVLDPLRTGEERGPAEATISPEKVADVLESRIVTAVYLDKISHGEFERARAIYRSSRSRYARKWRRFSKDPGLGSLFEQPTLSDLLIRACADLSQILGRSRLQQE